MKKNIILLSFLLLTSLCFAQNSYEIKAIENAIIVAKYQLNTSNNYYEIIERYIYFNDKKLPFGEWALFNIGFIKKVGIPYDENIFNSEELYSFEDGIDCNWQKNLLCSEYENYEYPTISSSHWYTRKSNYHVLYVAYKFTGQIVEYQFQEKQRLPWFLGKDMLHKKFAILKKAETLSGLNNVEIKKLRLNKTGILSINYIDFSDKCITR